MTHVPGRGAGGRGAGGRGAGGRGSCRAAPPAMASGSPGSWGGGACPRSPGQAARREARPPNDARARARRGSARRGRARLLPSRTPRHGDSFAATLALARTPCFAGAGGSPGGWCGGACYGSTGQPARREARPPHDAATRTETHLDVSLGQCIPGAADARTEVDLRAEPLPGWGRSSHRSSSWRRTPAVPRRRPPLPPSPPRPRRRPPSPRHRQRPSLPPAPL